MFRNKSSEVKRLPEVSSQKEAVDCTCVNTVIIAFRVGQVSEMQTTVQETEEEDVEYESVWRL